MTGPLFDVSHALRTLWVAGSGTPAPGLLGEVARAGEAARSAGAERLAEAVDAMAEALKAGDASALFGAQLQAWARLRALQRGLAAGELRGRLAAGASSSSSSEPEGWSGGFHPIGAVVVPPRVQVHGVDDDGRWRTFMERSIHVDGYDPWSGQWISRLFQAELSLGRALSRRWTVRGHPGIPTARRWVGKPAFRSRPILGSERPEVRDLPLLPVAERMGFGRAEVVAQHDAKNGWTVRSGGHQVRLGPCLRFNLDKLAAVEGPTLRRDAVVLAGSGERVLLQWGTPPCFPTLDPGACTWRAADIRAKATGGWGAVLRVLLGPWIGVSPPEALASMDGFPLPQDQEGLGGDHSLEANHQAFWRQWVGLLAGRAVRAPAPGLVAALRGAAAGEPVGAERLLQALWSLEQGEALRAEGAVLSQVAALRPVPRDGDVLEAVLQARLARHGVLGDPDARDEEALQEAYIERIEEEAEAVARRLAHDGVLPELVELFWLGDAVAEAKEEPRSQGVGSLKLDAERIDRTAVAVLGAWMRSTGLVSRDEVLAFAAVAGGRRMESFVGA